VSEACGGRVGWGTALQARRLCVWLLMALEFFHWHNPCGWTLALGSIQPLVEICMGGVVVGKGSLCIGLTSSPPLHADCFKISELETPGILWAYNRSVHGFLYLYLVLWVSIIKMNDTQNSKIGTMCELMMLKLDPLSLPFGNRFKYKLCLAMAWISLTLCGHLNGSQVNTWRSAHYILSLSVCVRDQHMIYWLVHLLWL